MRLDKYLFERSLAKSRSRAVGLIKAGRVVCGGKIVDRPSFEVADGDAVEVLGGDREYVSRGAYKLLGALELFGVDPSGAVCADIGASTGGFTEVLLERGAARVFAVDSGHGQLDASLAADSRVISLEGVNARYLSPETLGTTVDLAVCDVSFISQTLLHPAIASILGGGGTFIGLVKPQFELTKGDLSKGGIVRDAKKRALAAKRVAASLEENGFRTAGFAPSPIKGGDGNTEYLICAVRLPDGEGINDDLIERIVLNEDRNSSAKGQ